MQQRVVHELVELASKTSRLLHKRAPNPLELFAQAPRFKAVRLAQIAQRLGAQACLQPLRLAEVGGRFGAGGGGGGFQCQRTHLLLFRRGCQMKTATKRK